MPRRAAAPGPDPVTPAARRPSMANAAAGFTAAPRAQERHSVRGCSLRLAPAAVSSATLGPLTASGKAAGAFSGLGCWGRLDRRAETPLLRLPTRGAVSAVKAGTTTREIALKWPSAKDAWGYDEEDQAAANLWGHGLGLAQYDPPVISRIWSLDHPVEIKEGMTFALETQHGKKFRYGVRIEEMLIVHKNEIEIVSNFPVKQITVVDPIPGYGDHVK
jgi:hypothetical protein